MTSCCRAYEHAALACCSLVMVACQPADDSVDPSPPVMSAAAAADETASPLEGAWRLVAIQYIDSAGTVTEGTPQESLFIFTRDYYSMGYSHHEAPSPVFADPWSPTEAELQERFSALVVNAGTWELNGSVLNLRPEFALWPAVIDSRTEIEIELSGDELTLTYLEQVAADGTSDPWYAGGARYVLRLERRR